MATTQDTEALLRAKFAALFPHLVWMSIGDG
jgi:hypothetical protein